MVFTSILEGPEWEHEAEVRPWERGNGIREEKVAEVGEEDEEEAEKLPVRLWAKRGGLQLLWQLQTSQYYLLGRSYPPNGPSRSLSRCCSHRRLEKSFFVRAECSMRCLPCAGCKTGLNVKETCCYQWTYVIVISLVITKNVHHGIHGKIMKLSVSNLLKKRWWIIKFSFESLHFRLSTCNRVGLE